MADTYVQFSEHLDGLTEEAEVWSKMVLTLNPEEHEEAKKLREELGLQQVDLGTWPEFEWSILSDHCLWLHSTFSYEPEHLIWFVQALLKKFLPNEIFTLTCSATCSMPRIGEFGGDWLVISATAVKEGNTWAACKRAKEALRKEMEDAKR